MKIGSKLYLQQGMDEYRIIVTEEPIMKNSEDAYWEEVRNIFIDEENVKIYADTMYGKYGYFKFNDEWYKVSTENWEDMSDSQKFKMEYY